MFCTCKHFRINITAVYNYSKVELTESMEKILNRGLNFCIDPITLNLTEVLVDFTKFEWKMKWIEFWAKKENTEDMEYKLFKKEKSNLPTTKSSKTLSNFLIGVKSELTSTPVNKTQPTTTREVAEALKTLIDLQKLT